MMLDSARNDLLRSRSTATWLVVVAVLSIAVGSRVSAAETIDYQTEIKPLLAARCYACHGALRQLSGLRLDTAAAIRAGGEQGPAIEPGHSEQSLLIGAVTGSAGFRMPPEGEGEHLTEDEVTRLRRWIDAGAPAPADEQPERDPRRHWAFQKSVRPDVPQVADPAWQGNPIDAFVAAEHARRGLQPSPEADRLTLLRRVAIDLTGLPPTREELQAFAADEAPDAYERAIDGMLASPRHAERWARHWMDVWRYSDWYGKRNIGQHRNSRRFIWRWRDWIVESLAANKPYDRMLAEMLAGDELAPGDDDVHRATGYLGRSFYVYNRHVWLQDTVEFTGAAMLGLTLKCCRCHDHKYDPISQADYYALQAVFEPYDVRTDRLPGKPATMSVTNPPGTGTEQVLVEGFDRVFDSQPDAVTYLLERGNEKRPRKDQPMAPGVPRVLVNSDSATENAAAAADEPAPLAVAAVKLPVDAFYPDLRDFVVAETRATLTESTAQAEAALNKARDELNAALAQVAVGANTADAATATAIQTAALRGAGLLHNATQAELTALDARVAAETARYAEPPIENFAELARSAATLERAAKLAAAERHVSVAEAALSAAQAAVKPDDAKSAAAVTTAEQKLAASRESLEKARQAAALSDNAEYAPLGPVYPRTSSGRRLALARWITGPDNPLTARVAVNHIWLRHFGSPLVATVSDFGLRSAPPTHPELLDWLAVELVESGWDMRHLHRLIVTSRTYRQRSEPRGPGDPRLALDSANSSLWRANPRRAEAEVVRDALLHLAGDLDFAQDGADLDPALADTLPRRSLYFRHTPDDKPALLETFDAANPVECFRRGESVMPQQALVLVNGPLCLQQSRRVARKLSEAIGTSDSVATHSALLDKPAVAPSTESDAALPDKPAEAPGAAADQAFIAAAFEHLLARVPTDKERQRCGEFLMEESKREQPPAATPAENAAPAEATAKEQPRPPLETPPAANPRLRAREALVHVLLNHHEFVTVR
ncbi:MAG: PSD1 and planctomycete cytochrome C domain-containing protein [Pirellulales bacterium]|nr:PSD1 and planctomycete cytochrome C domain-containing protein [Pirellulales bacterium]